ncbi:MAG TPA: dockerin type I domain-containing protein, partial [Planctomycetota bacterium]|nr:dockerin type I domain-containing protein [Planctomycetota bacterium]
VLTGSYDKSARLWNAATGEQLRTFSGHTTWVLSVAYSPDGTKVLTGSSDCTARLWDAATGAVIRTFTGHTSSVMSVTFSADGTRVFTGSADGTARLWNVATGAPIRSFNGHTDQLTSVAYSPDGTTVLTGSKDKTAKLWDAGPQLVVRSSPITGVFIAGDAPGLTEYKTYTQASQHVTLTAPLLALTGAVRYDFVRWEIDGQQQPAGQLSVGFTVDRSMTAVAVYEIRKHTLAVSSEPVTGVSIAGKATNHALTVDDQQTVNLSAPTVASVSGVDYGFIRWIVDGQEQPQGQSVVSLLMDADRAATAVYFRAARLSVTSSPYSGIYLAGSHGDMTPFERVFLAPQNVTLSAQLRLFRGAIPYNFAYWKINGLAQQPRQTDIQLRVEADTAVEAIYHMLGDANGDCVVNVLDLIFIRNRLGKPIESADNCRADVNVDGSVDVLDLISTRNKLGARCQ